MATLEMVQDGCSLCSRVCHKILHILRAHIKIRQPSQATQEAGTKKKERGTFGEIYMVIRSDIYLLLPRPTRHSQRRERRKMAKTEAFQQTLLARLSRSR
jgi:hypothetical protein